MLSFFILCYGDVCGLRYQHSINKNVYYFISLTSLHHHIHATHIIRQDGFKSGLKNAFEYFINLKHNSSASLIAKYVDRKLKGEKGITEQEVEQALDQV